MLVCVALDFHEVKEAFEDSDMKGVRESSRRVPAARCSPCLAGQALHGQGRGHEHVQMYERVSMPGGLLQR